MKTQLLVTVAIINHLLSTIVELCDGKYLVHANDSVRLHHCNVDNIANIREINSSPEEIIIHECRLGELKNALFIRFHRLKQLEITDSELHAVSDFAFTGMKSLQLLNLSRNNLTSVSKWSNEPLVSLHLLDLRRNTIASVAKDALAHYPNLLKLNLAVNHITHLPDELFRATPSLRYLNLAKNYLRAIDEHTFKHLHKLLNLEIRHNQIERIDADSFVGLTHLRVLHLQENLLTMFPHELTSNMPRLHHLNLSHNRLDEFSDETFARNEELVSLDIAYNNLKTFAELTFKGLEVLEVLNASHNTIRFIDNTTFYDAGNLQFLDLSHNQLTKLSRCFTNQPKLDAVKLNNNSLEWISDDAFESLNLSHLDLSCNKLQSGAFLWPSTVNVRFLNLTFNDFVEIDVSLLENISVDLWGNPFKCEWLAREVLTSKNVRLGRNYSIVEANQDISKIEGIQCFDGNGTEPHKLLVVVVQEHLPANDEISSPYQPHRKSNFENPPSLASMSSSSSEDEFDYRSILLWLSFGCTIVFIGLRVLRCWMDKSEELAERRHHSQIQTIAASVVDEEDVGGVESEMKSSSIDILEK